MTYLELRHVANCPPADEVVCELCESQRGRRCQTHPSSLWPTAWELRIRHQVMGHFGDGTDK